MRTTDTIDTARQLGGLQAGEIPGAPRTRAYSLVMEAVMTKTQLQAVEELKVLSAKFKATDDFDVARQLIDVCKANGLLYCTKAGTWVVA